MGPVYLVIFCYWVGPVPYLELFGAGPVEKNTLYMIKIFQLMHAACFCCEKVSLTLAFGSLSRFRIFVKFIVEVKMFKPKDDLLPTLQMG